MLLQMKVLIVRDPKILGGKPIIKGTRISVELIIRKFSNGNSIDQLLINYPNLSKDQILECFEYAAEILANEQVLELV